MKVLWLAPLPYSNGTNFRLAPWIGTLAKALLNNGVDLTILSYSSKIEAEIIKKEIEGIKLIYIRTPIPKKDFLTFYKIRINAMKNYLYTIVDNYDLLHIHGSEHQFEVMACDLKIPKLISIQGIMSEYVKILPIFSNMQQFAGWKLSAKYEKKYLPEYRYFSCRTHWDINYIKSINPKAKIYTIWEMIREDFFEDHFSNDKKNILLVGGKNPIKGLQELLKAYDSSLQKKGLKLIILGLCEVNDIEKIIQKENLISININNIECRGKLDAKGMTDAYNESFCLVHPTYIDNSPNSVCEAQLSGLPVIATNVGGVASLIEDGETGLLIGRGCSDIERAVERLLEDDKLRKKLSEKSRLIARERHDPDFILKETLNMYHDIVNDKS